MSWFPRAALHRPYARRLSRAPLAVAIAVALASQAGAQAPMTVALARTASSSACAAIDSSRTRQALAPSDSTAPCATRPASSSEPASRRRSRLPYLFYGGLAAALAANSFAHVDRDPGGYQDSWGTETYFPDKGVHALGAFALTTVGVDLKLSPWKSAAAVCAAGAVFETTQGYVSKHDIAADCIGAGLAGLWRHWRTR